VQETCCSWKSSDLPQREDFTLQEVEALDGQIEPVLVLNELQANARVLRCVTYGNWGQSRAPAHQRFAGHRTQRVKPEQ
jgi:hypothetical protein